MTAVVDDLPMPSGDATPADVVRANRAALRLPELDDADREPDYTSLYGKDA